MPRHHRVRIIRCGQAQAHGTCTALWVCAVLFGACNSPGDSVTIEGLTLEVWEQGATERIWADVSFNLLHELPLPKEPDVYLLKPEGIRVDADGHVYVNDWGDMTVKRFNAHGEYVTTYGSGIGSAPGEFLSIFDTSTVGDSMVYVLDLRAERISLFASGGSFVKTKVAPHRAIELSVTPIGRSYFLLTTGGASVFETSLGSETRGFGTTLLEGQRYNDFMMLSGFLTTYGENMVYLPMYFPAIIQYNPNGELVYARTTPDFGHTVPPRTSSPAPHFTRLEAKTIQMFPVADSDRINVYSRTDTTAIDVYDAPTGDYLHSIALPFGTSIMRQNRIYNRRDTTIVVYSVDS